MAVLVASEPYSVSREDLSRAIWPDKESKQNLRQAIYSLRKAIGHEMIEATLEGCRLTSHFRYQCDLKDLAFRDSVAFMPDFVSEWSDQMRVTEDFASEEEQSQSAIDGLLAMLGWYAKNDPKGFYKVLASSPDMVRGIDYHILLNLINSTQLAKTSLSGWSLFWRGTAENDLSLVASLLKQAWVEAKNSDDILLASEVALELGKVYARLGKPKSALNVCAAADELALKSSLSVVKANSLALRGTVLCHYGESEKGIGLLEAAEPFVDDTLALAIRRSSRAFFLASVGRNQEAAIALDWAMHASSGLGHRRIQRVSDMTSAIMASNECEKDVAIPALEKLYAETTQAGFSQFNFYAAELLAKHYVHVGEKEMANQKLLSARQSRAQSKSAITPLESARVSSLPA